VETRAKGTTTQGTWGDWLTPAEAWARVLDAWRPPLMPSGDVPLTAAHRRVLASAVIAPVDSPAFDRSAVDGYAVYASDVATAIAEAPVALRFIGTVTMGAQAAIVVERGEAAWVATGAMMPRGADAMVMVERTMRVEPDGPVLVGVSRPIGADIVRRGDDLREGMTVLPAGRRLSPRDIAALASMGLALVPVRARPRVAIISGGDELVTPGTPLGPGQIYDSNSYALAAQTEAWGGVPCIYPRVEDDEDAVLQALQGALRESDVVLVSGGSSVGLKDLTSGAITAAGKPGVVVHGVAMRPGRPTLLGVVDGVYVVGIPGNPVTAMIVSETFVRPAVETLLGVDAIGAAGLPGGAMVYGTLAEPIGSLAGRQDYIRVRLDHAGDESAVSVVRPLPGGSNSIRSMVDADGLLVVPPDRDSLEKGERVAVHLFAS